VLCALPFLWCASANAQTVPDNKLELTAFAGYQVNSTVNLGSGILEVAGGPSYGAIVDIAVRRAAFVEILWLGSVSSAYFNAYSSGAVNSLPFNLSINYFQIGGTQGFPNGPIEPYIGLTVGASVFHPDSITLENGTTYPQHDTWKFAFTAAGGAKVFIIPQLALRFEARIAAPVYFTSGVLYAGSGGAGLIVSGGIPFVQGDFTVGLVFAMQ
jgi:hypothetical protein